MRNLARRLLDTPELRAADSLQLAEALTWCRQRRAKRFCVRRSTTIQGRNSGWVLRPGILSSGTSRSCLETFINPTLSMASDSVARSLSDHFQVTRRASIPKSVNKVILVGNVGKDPEVRYSQSGTPVANFSLATNERFKGRNGEWQERTEWHSIVAWERLAEIVGEYVAKGSKLYVEGKIQTSSWEDRQSGVRKYRTEIVARELLLLGPRENGGRDHQSPTSDDQEDQRSQASSSESVDEDVPF